MTLTDLIAALERAEGPSWELDEAIYRHIGYWWDNEEAEWCAPDSPRAAEGQEPPAYTSSLDAALSLVLEGWSPMIGQNVHHKTWMALVQRVSDDGEIIGPHANGATPAIALTLAALKARA